MNEIKLKIDDIREVLQISSPDIPTDGSVIKRALNDLSDLEKMIDELKGE